LTAVFCFVGFCCGLEIKNSARLETGVAQKQRADLAVNLPRKKMYRFFAALGAFHNTIITKISKKTTGKTKQYYVFSICLAV